MRATDGRGVKSGRDVNKWPEMNLTPIPSQTVAAPAVAESPVSIECKVTQVLELGTHDMFLAKVTAVRVDDQYVDPATGAFELEKPKPIRYSHRKDHTAGKALGKLGSPVQKKK